MSSVSIDLSGPAAAAAISAASAIIAEVLGRSPSRAQSKDASNQLAARTGELARLILETMSREPLCVDASSGPSAAAAPSRPPAPNAAEPAPTCGVGW